MKLEDTIEKREELLRQLDDAASIALEEMEKAMHIEGNLADFFDLRDKSGKLSDSEQTEILSEYPSAALDNDIAHDYLIQTADQLNTIRILLNDLYELYRR